MSGRAIQRLREQREKEQQEQEQEQQLNSDDATSSDDDDDDYESSARTKTKTGGFSGLMMMDDDDSSSSSSSSSSSLEEEDDDEVEGFKTNSNTKQIKEKKVDADEGDVDENLDTLLEEFKYQDQVQQKEQTCDADDSNGNVVGGGDSGNSARFSMITFGMDKRELDIDYVQRTSLVMGSDPNNNEVSTTPRRGGGGGRHKSSNVFGPPRDNWPRPPSYIGGGIGMISYKDSMTTGHQIPIPWPYNDGNSVSTNRWFTFQHSDSYLRDQNDYKIVKSSGDPNMMTMFVAHHPFVVEPLLQLSSVLYHTNNNAIDGLAFLKRVLFMYDCAALNTFFHPTTRKSDDTATTTAPPDVSCSMMDYNIPANKYFFETLFRLVRVGYVAGLHRCCFAVSRLLLSLDPLRDPMNILLGLDHFALVQTNTPHQHATCWLVDFIDSKSVRIYWNGDGAGCEDKKDYDCDLLDMPNWSYSYALALHRIYEKEQVQDAKKRADDALLVAYHRYPFVLEELLLKNNIDIVGRSFQREHWPSIIQYGLKKATYASFQLSKLNAGKTSLTRRIEQSVNTISKIFVQQNFKLWNSHNVLQWCHDTIQHHITMEEERIGKSLLSEKESAVLAPVFIPVTSELSSSDNNSGGGVSIVDSSNKMPVLLPSPALIRYAQAELVDYEDKFHTLPDEAFPLDTALVAHARTVDLNRRRLIQNNNQRGRQQLRFQDDELYDADFLRRRQRRAFFGPPTHAIDPDLPLLEVFWRSILPWVYVEGV